MSPGLATRLLPGGARDAPAQSHTPRVLAAACQLRAGRLAFSPGPQSSGKGAPASRAVGVLPGAAAVSIRRGRAAAARLDRAVRPQSGRQCSGVLPRTVHSRVGPMRTLVTGATGFIGRHLAERLVRE